MKDCPFCIRTGLSFFTACTFIKYNHSRLYGQLLDPNLHDLHPRVMVAGEHQEDKEGGSFVLVLAWRLPCSFRYNCQGKLVQGKREFRHSDLTTVRLQKPE
jgi:hypothetical protein